MTQLHWRCLLTAASLRTRATFLVAVLFFGILTLWIPAKWPVAVFQVAVFLLCGFTLFQESVAFGFQAVALGLASLWGVLQIVSRQTAGSFDTACATLSWATLLSLYVAAVNVFNDSRCRESSRTAMLWFTFVVSVVATLQCFTSGGKVLWIFATDYAEGVMGPILYRNHFAAWIELMLPAALWGTFHSRSNVLLYSCMSAAMYASVIASGSRAGTVLCTAEVCLVPAIILFRKSATRRQAAAALAKMAGALAAFTGIVGWEVIWSRLKQPDPYFLRREFVESSLGMIRDRPWLGFGLGTWPTVYPAYAIVDSGAFVNRAHNDWLEWAADGGVPFALLFLAIAMWSIRPAIRTVWGLGVLAVFLHATVDYPFSRPQLAGWTIVVIAMLAADDKGVDAEHPSGIPKLRQTSAS